MTPSSESLAHLRTHSCRFRCITLIYRHVLWVSCEMRVSCHRKKFLRHEYSPWNRPHNSFHTYVWISWIFFIAPMETRSTGVRCSRANRRPTTFMVAYFVQWLSEIPKGSWNLCATEVSVVELECKTWHTWASEINGKCRGEIYWRCGPQARQARPAVSSISSFTLLSNHPCLTFRNRTYS